jgi:protein phosphatase
VEEMVRSGRLRRDQVRNHPEKNIITRAIGESRDVLIDFFDVALNPGDTLLLCSDGLTNMVEDGQIFRILKREKNLETAGIRLIEEANRNGGRDNISVILVKVPPEGEGEKAEDFSEEMRELENLSA